MRAAKLLFTAYAFATLVGCSVYDKTLIGKQPDGGDNGCAPGTVGCFPGPPPDVDAGVADQSAVFALNAIVLNQNAMDADGGTTNAWKNIGFDLDGYNTTPLSSGSGCLPPSGNDAPPVDGTNGIDNVFGSKLWPVLGGGFGRFEENLCCYMQKGRGTLLLRLTGWNGTPNDAHVTASLVNAADGTTDPANTVHWNAAPAVQGLVHADSSPAAPPGWDPNQTTWFVDPTSLAPGASATLDDANQIDAQAYIREGYLVMALNNEPLSLFMGEGADIQMTLAGGHLMAKIAADGLHIESGIFGGRMGKNALIKASAGLIGDCGGADLITAPLLPMFADVMQSLTNEPTAKCDAVSVGIPFRAVRAIGAQVATGGGLCYPVAVCPTQVTSCRAVSEGGPGPGPTPEQCDPNNCVTAPGICTGFNTGDAANDCNHATWD